MAELADALDLGSSGVICAGSSPVTRTRKRQVSTETCRFQLYSPYGELYAPSVRDICFASDMPAGVSGEYNITAKRSEAISQRKAQGERGYVVPFGDGPRPLYERRVGKSLIKSMVEGARDYVYITTPYLIIDNELCQCFEDAALKGVDVRIVVPHIPDKKIVFAMTRSFYPRLMAAGVKIYEYEPGFIHAKTYLTDGKFAMVGTINLDYRSLVHHFENGVWLYDCASIADIRKDMDDTMDKSILVTNEMIKTNLAQRFFRSVVRIFAALL